MSLTEQIFVNRQFLNDLDSICNITFAKILFSNWGFRQDETINNITDMAYVSNNIIEDHSVWPPFIADTFIEDDLVVISLPTNLNLDLYYSMIIYYQKEIPDATPEDNIAIIMYTQSLHDAAVLPLVSLADNRIYLDLRALPLKAHLLTFNSPYNQPQADTPTQSEAHAPAYHQHKTHTESASSQLPSAYTDSNAIASAIKANSELTADTSNIALIQEDGLTNSQYMPSNKDSVQFFRNVVGCAYEWANSRLCTEDLVDANNIITLSDISEPIVIP